MSRTPPIERIGRPRTWRIARRGTGVVVLGRIGQKPILGPLQNYPPAASCSRKLPDNRPFADGRGWFRTSDLSRVKRWPPRHGWASCCASDARGYASMCADVRDNGHQNASGAR
jgi:hypothetical protein